MALRLLPLLFLLAATLARAGDDLPATAPLFAANLWDTDDKPVALERYRGKPLIVNFWARWCGPCRQEIPELIKVRAAHKVDLAGLVRGEVGRGRRADVDHLLDKRLVRALILRVGLVDHPLALAPFFQHKRAGRDRGGHVRVVHAVMLL